MLGKRIVLNAALAEPAPVSLESQALHLTLTLKRAASAGSSVSSVWQPGTRQLESNLPLVSLHNRSIESSIKPTYRALYDLPKYNIHIEFFSLNICMGITGSSSCTFERGRE